MPGLRSRRIDRRICYWFANHNPSISVVWSDALIDISLLYIKHIFINYKYDNVGDRLRDSLQSVVRKRWTSEARNDLIFAIEILIKINILILFNSGISSLYSYLWYNIIWANQGIMNSHHWSSKIIVSPDFCRLKIFSA